MAYHGFACNEKRPQETIDRLHVFVQRQVHKHGSLIVHNAYRVESDVDAAGFRRNCIGMLFNRPLIEGVNLCGFYRSTRCNDVSRYSVEPGLCAPGDKNACAFSGEYACHGSTNGATTPVNNSVLIF